MIHICGTPEELAAAAADHIAEALDEVDGPATLGLAGGATPRATYAEMVGRAINWTDTTMWLGDERWRNRHHPESNAAMARAALVDRVGGRLLAPNDGIRDPAAAAATYEAALTSAFIDRGSGPAPDIVLLGVGEDGHTASLFPGTTALDDFTNLYVASWVETKDAWRLTATLPLLWSASELVFIVTGVAKAAIVRQIIVDGVPYPAQQAAASARRVTWFLDHEAAGMLD